MVNGEEFFTVYGAVFVWLGDSVITSTFTEPIIIFFKKQKSPLISQRACELKDYARQLV
jgi:hypothetical protein